MLMLLMLLGCTVERPAVKKEEIVFAGPVPAIECLQGENKNFCLCKSFDCGLVTLPKENDNLHNAYFNEKWYLIGTIE